MVTSQLRINELLSSLGDGRWDLSPFRQQNVEPLLADFFEELLLCKYDGIPKLFNLLQLLNMKNICSTRVRLAHRRYIKLYLPLTV